MYCVYLKTSCIYLTFYHSVLQMPIHVSCVRVGQLKTGGATGRPGRDEAQAACQRARIRQSVH